VSSKHQQSENLCKGLGEMPDWRIGCIFTGSGHRRNGLRGRPSARRWPRSTMLEVGSSRPTPSKSRGAPPQRGGYFHTGPSDLFEEFGCERDRMIAKWRWVMRPANPVLTETRRSVAGVGDALERTHKAVK